MTLYELNKDKDQYYNMREQIMDIIVSLDNSIDNLDNVVRNFNSTYSVDENSNCKIEVAKQKDKLVTRYNFLKNQVVPEINIQIEKVKNQIEEEQMKLT